MVEPKQAVLTTPPAAADRDAAELLDVDVDRGAGASSSNRSTLRSCSPLGGSRLATRLMPRRTRTRCTVTGATVMPWSACRTAAMRAAPNLVDRRISSMRSATSGAGWVGERPGADGRSSRPAAPSACQRAYHLARQRREIPASAATWAIGRPASTRSHSLRRPDGGQGCAGARTCCRCWTRCRPSAGSWRTRARPRFGSRAHAICTELGVPGTDLLNVERSKTSGTEVK